MKRRTSTRIRITGFAAALLLLLPAVSDSFGALPVQAATTSGNSASSEQLLPPKITDDDRAEADAQLKSYMDSILKRTKPDSFTLKKLNDTFYSAVYYIANTELSHSELWAYVETMKGKLDAVIPDVSVSDTTTQFLQIGNNWETPSVRYGENVSIVLPIINLGSENLTDLMVKPLASNMVAEWPFEPETSGYVQTFAEIPGNPYKSYEAGMFQRRELTFQFSVREDVMTGYYPLDFEVWYSKSGVRCEEPLVLSVYVYCQGKPGSSKIGGDEGAAEPNSRIIVTGFKTDPEEVYAGSTFMATIHVKNTSHENAVTNVLFDLQAVESGSEANTTYAVFLPTSGSSSVYTSQIGAGQSFDINIEMTAKTDLTQKPYVITVKMKYDSGKNTDLTDEAKVSVPVLQKAKYDTGSVDVLPDSIGVGSQSNVVFSIYNTGKTNFYNLQIKYEGNSVEGGETFLGTLKPGETGNVDSMLTGKAPSTDDGTVKAVISFEDEAGKPHTFEKEFQLMVMDEIMADPGIIEFPEDPEPSQGISLVTILVIVFAAAAAAVTALVLILKRRRKKIAMRKLEEELLDLKTEDEASKE